MGRSSTTPPRRPDRACAGRSPIAASRRPASSSAPAPRSTRSTDADLWADFAADGRLEPDGSTARPERPSEAIGAAVAATVDARARRASVGPVRARLGPADGRVRGRAVAGGSATPATGAGPALRACDLATHALEQTPAWRAAIEAWQAPDPRRPRPARLVQGGPLQRAVLPRRRRHRSGRPARSDGPEPDRTTTRPVRAARVPRLPVLRHGRRRLLRVVRDPASCSRSSRCAGSATCSRRSRSTTPRSSRSRRPALRAPAQGRRHGAPRRRRAGRRPVLPAQPVPRSRTSATGRTSGPKFVLQVWRDAVAAGAEAAMP